MKPRILLLVTVLVALAVNSPSAVGQTSNNAIAYQGRLKVGGGTPDPGAQFDLRFRLFDAAAGGGQLDESFVQMVAPDSNGLFTVIIDAHTPWSSSFTVQWVELGARRSGTSNYVTLTPRQRVSPVPKALHAQHADMANAFTGAVSVVQLPAAVARLDAPQTFTASPSFTPVTGPPFMVSSTQRVANLSADLLDGMDATAFWRRETNGGVSSVVQPEDLPVEIHIQSTRVQRFERGMTSPNLIGGSSANAISQAVSGSVIAGGGNMASPNSIGANGAFVGAGRNNLINSNADYSVVTGGDGNQIAPGARDSIIGGGTTQRIGSNSIDAGIFGGFANEVMANSRFAGVLLGEMGKVRENSDFAAVVSGEKHSIGPNAPHSVIGGGAANSIRDGANHSFVGSGQQNLISTGAFHSAIGGGQNNQVGNGAYRSVVGGGNNNGIGPASYNAFLGGGGDNRIEFNAPYSAILGGNLNLVRSNAGWATVLGGVESVAGAPFAIAGGHGAKAEHSGSIVLADGQYANFASSNFNEFAVRAAGGVRFVTGGAGLTIDGQRFTASGAVTNTANADTLDGFDSGDFWKITGNLGTTAGVNFLGTRDNEALDLRVANRRALRLQPDEPFNCGPGNPLASVLSPNLIGGFAGNSIAVTNAGSVIAGGGASTIPCVGGPPLPNSIVADFANISGGQNNRIEGDNSAIGGGISHRIGPNATVSVIGGGSVNQVAASAIAATIAGGRNNYVGTSAGGTVGGGHGNRAENQFATVPGGVEARATQYGQLAYAGGAFANPGDAQTSLYVLRGITTGNELGELFLDGAAQRLRVPTNSAWTFDILIVALSDATAAAGFQVRGVIKRDGLSGTTVIGDPLPTETVLGRDIQGWGATAVADDVHDALAIFVATPPGTTATVRWVATVRTVEVRF